MIGQKILMINEEKQKSQEYKNQVLNLINEYVSQLSFNERFYQVNCSIENAFNRLVKANKYDVFEKPIDNEAENLEQDDNENMQFQITTTDQKTVRMSNLTQSDSYFSQFQSTRGRNIKLKINKIEGEGKKLVVRLQETLKKNEFTKLVMGLDVTIKKQMMYLDTEDAVVSSITGNKVNLIDL